MCQLRGHFDLPRRFSHSFFFFVPFTPLGTRFRLELIESTYWCTYKTFGMCHDGLRDSDRYEKMVLFLLSLVTQRAQAQDGQQFGLRSRAPVGIHWFGLQELSTQILSLVSCLKQKDPKKQT